MIVKTGQALVDEIHPYVLANIMHNCRTTTVPVMSTNAVTLTNATNSTVCRECDDVSGTSKRERKLSLF